MSEPWISEGELGGACRFCSPPDPERILWEGRDFYVMLSLGPIWVGHMMIVSSEHYDCCAALSDGIGAEFDRLQERLMNRLREEAGAVTGFEHGRCGTSLSSPDTHCYHAHLHMVPLGYDLEGAVQAELEGAEVRDWSAIRDWFRQSSKDYLFASNGRRGGVLFADPAKLRRQYLRIALAKGIGCEEKWNWRTNAGWEDIARGRERFAAAVVGLSED